MDSDNFATDETLSNLEKLCGESESCYDEIKSDEPIELNSVQKDGLLCLHDDILIDDFLFDKNRKSINERDNILAVNGGYKDTEIVVTDSDSPCYLDNLDDAGMISISKLNDNSATNEHLFEKSNILSETKSTDFADNNIIEDILIDDTKETDSNELDEIIRVQNTDASEDMPLQDDTNELHLSDHFVGNFEQPEKDNIYDLEKDAGNRGTTDDAYEMEAGDIQNTYCNIRETIESEINHSHSTKEDKSAKIDEEVNIAETDDVNLSEVVERENLSDNLSNNEASQSSLNESDFVVCAVGEQLAEEMSENIVDATTDAADIDSDATAERFDTGGSSSIKTESQVSEIIVDEDRQDKADKDTGDKDDTDVEEIPLIVKGLKNENIENGVVNNSDTKRTKNPSKRQIDVNKTSNKSGASKSNKQQECVVCKKVIKCKYNIVRNGDTKHLCNDECFGTFRAKPSSFLHSATSRYSKDSATCTYCRQVIVGRPIISTYADKQKFCKNGCLEEFKKLSKHCADCHKDLKKDSTSFSAPIDGEGFRDFCTQNCLVKYENAKKKNEHVDSKGIERCTKCGKTGAIKHKVNLNSVIYRLCSDSCFNNFKIANNLSINSGKCDNCSSNWSLDSGQTVTIRFEGEMKRFCGQACYAAFKVKKQRNIQCTWCALRKSNFDMVDTQDENKKTVLFCTLNCLSLYRVNLQANSNDSIACDQCNKVAPAQYHLTMSDASVRNFCGYNCVMAFQNKFVSATGKQVPTPSQQVTQNTAHQAQTTSKSPYGTRQSSKAKHVAASTSFEDIPASSKSLPQVIVQPPPPKQVRNKALLCKPYMQTKATSCRPHVISRPTQTDENWEPQKLALPCPVPMMVPAPMAMYSTPTPYPILIPIPIPIPCFIPTTRKSAGGIMKKIKEMQDRMPSDPFEAELLMMAEAVASAGRESESEYEASEEDDVVGLVGVEGGSGDVAEDMLQMALRMADMPSDEPILDLEDSVAPAQVRAREVQPVVQDYAVIDPVMEMLPSISLKKQATKRRSNSGAPRSNQNPRGGPVGVKRSRIDGDQTAVSLMQSQPLQPPTIPEPPADTNFVLKFTYGVNAYKHWVVQKNAQIETQILANQQRGASVRGLKPFKLDVLQSTADELNYALCLFVREVRKPNGEEYAPDSILYLCLGIQEYLYENGRIDNIFTDFFYERFTEYLNEVLSRYEVRLNAQGMLVCRIEEEHLWEAKQLGAHSPYVLLNTLVYFNTKHFMLRTPHEHLALSFSHIMKHWKKTNCPSGKPGRSVYLRYYSPGQGMDPKRKKKKVPTATLR